MKRGVRLLWVAVALSVQGVSGAAAPVITSTEVYPLKNMAQNAHDIVAALSFVQGTEFAFAADGNDKIVIACLKASCITDIPAVKSKIDALAHPPAPAPGPPGPAQPIDLFYCLSGTLGVEPEFVGTEITCGGSEVGVLAQTAVDVSSALAKESDYTVTAQGKTRLLVVCKTGLCAPLAPGDRIFDLIGFLGKPSPAYLEDKDVPAGRAADIAAKITAQKLPGITAQAIGASKVRLLSEGPVSEPDVTGLVGQYLFGNQAPPAFRMFYQDPTKVVPAIAPPPASPTAGSSSGSGAPANSASSAAPPSSSPVAKPASGTDTPANTVQFTVKSETSNSVAPPPAQPPAAAADPAPPADSTAPKTPAPVISTSTTTTFTPPPPAPATPTPATPTPIGKDLAAVNDNVVFTDTSNDSLVWQRVRLLTLLDLPRPEVLMNVWSYQASSPDGNEVLKSSQNVRNLVSAHNDALENAIEYGWAYLSREMKKDLLHQSPPAASETRGPTEQEARRGGMPTEPGQTLTGEDDKGKIIGGPFFDHDFYDYITQKFVGDPKGELDNSDRAKWGFCPVGKFCLGFTDAFQPVRPNLTSILMGAIASSDPLKTILLTIGCMEGKYEVYPECFPEREAIANVIQDARQEIQDINRTNKQKGKTPSARKTTSASKATSGGNPPDLNCTVCSREIEDLETKVETAREKARQNQKCLQCSEQVKSLQAQLDQLNSGESDYQRKVKNNSTCLRNRRRNLIADKKYKGRLDCETLDAVALEAQEQCQVVQTFPLSCFTIQAAQSFNSHTAYSTFTLNDLNELAEEPLANLPVVSNGEDTPKKSNAGTTRVGLLRAAVADFLFNYKMSQEFPKDFAPYDLQHSAQELNAELNPLVVAFNQDVAAYSRHLSDRLDELSPNQTSFVELWRNHNSFLSDGIITVRGIGGYSSNVDTLTQNFYDSTQAQSLSSILNSLSGQGGGSSGSGGTAAASPTASVLTALQQGLNPTTAIAALAAITPQATQAKIGRQLTFTVTPHTLPGASSAELDVQLTAGESADSSLYSEPGSATGAASLVDSTSRVAHHDVTTRVRVESVKMFELSSFSALVQRPRSRIPLVPPFIELPWVGNFASVPLPGAKEYHRSTAIVSAVIVPTAADLAYGIAYTHDRLITGITNREWGRDYQMQSVTSLSQYTRTPIRPFHKAMVRCFATDGGLITPGARRLNVDDAKPAACHEQVDFRTLPPEF